MNIVFLTSSLGAGGAERVSTILCNAWSARGDQVTLIPTYSGGGAPFYQLSEQVDTLFLADQAGVRSRSLRGYVRRLLTLRRLILGRRPDVVVSFLPNVNVAAIVAMAGSRVPLIVCERNDPSSRSPLNPWEFASRMIFRFADMLTVQTEAVAPKAAARYPGVARIRVVPNPLAPSAVPPAQPAGAEGQRRILLSLGRLARQKGVDTIIRAFAELAPHHPDWDLHIYGEGPLADTLATLAASLGMQERIAFKGVTTEPARVMAGADAFAMASLHEGFPNTLLEAMSLGLPCLSTDCPSGPGEITRNGRDALLVPVNDQAAFTSALHWLMGNAALRRNLGQEARASIQGRFALDAVLARWDELFAEVMPERADGRPRPADFYPARAQFKGSEE
ncbi:MAG: glycosyltransferase family 4 protein [Burkholderiaceae bacterium]